MILLYKSFFRQVIWVEVNRNPKAPTWAALLDHAQRDARAAGEHLWACYPRLHKTYTVDDLNPALLIIIRE